jgi:hypothetical protein
MTDLSSITSERILNVSKRWNITTQDAYELILNFETLQNRSPPPLTQSTLVSQFEFECDDLEVFIPKKKSKLYIFRKLCCIC